MSTALESPTLAINIFFPNVIKLTQVEPLIYTLTNKNKLKYYENLTSEIEEHTS